MFAEESGGMGFFGLYDLLRSSFGDHTASLFPSVGPQIDDVVGTFDHIHIVFDDNDGVTVIHQFLEGLEKDGDVVRVKSDGGFIE